MPTEIQEITSVVIGSAIEVHRELGPGLLESAYADCMLYELEKTNLKLIHELYQPVMYKGLKLEKAYKIDLLINDQLVIELKAVQAISDLHIAQVLTYMKLGKYPYGLLINFNVKLLKDGIRRLLRSEFLPKKEHW